jgi:hypothetical protein
LFSVVLEAHSDACLVQNSYVIHVLWFVPAPPVCCIIFHNLAFVVMILGADVKCCEYALFHSMVPVTIHVQGHAAAQGVYDYWDIDQLTDC